MRITHVPVITGTKKYKFEEFLDCLQPMGYMIEASCGKHHLSENWVKNVTLTLYGQKEQDLLELESYFKRLSIIGNYDPVQDDRLYNLRTIKERKFNLDIREDFQNALDFMEANIMKWDNQLVTENYEIC